MGFSKSRGLRASVTFFPLPHPLPSTFLPSPHFSRGPNAKTPLRGPNFVRFVRERLQRLLRRLHAACNRKLAEFDVLWTEILEFFYFPHLICLFIFGQSEDYFKENLFLGRKSEVTKRPISLHRDKAIAMAMCPIIVHFIT